PPREVSPVAPVDDVVVNVLGQPEEPAAAGADSAAGNGRSVAAGQFAAPALAENALQIDGEISDWDALPGSNQAAWTRFETITYDDACLSRFPGREAMIDLSGQVRFAYDDEALFVAFQVEDDGYVGYNGEGQEFFLGDSPQLSLDLELLSDLDDSERSADDWQIDFHPDPANPRAVLWQLGSLAARDFSEAIVASRFDQANYVLEAMIPWSSLDFRPQPGDRIGLAANINDNDTPGTNRQECIISTAPLRAWNNPTTWGTLLFEGDR
ncbi:MAG: sugar-binding protein, partial [Anaerolineae bacterium]|nr:sugar-binding protein [Anaerolineae bacterium]